MRAPVRLLLLLPGVLLVAGFAATSLLNSMTRAWFERDIATRSRLAASGARDAFAVQLAYGDGQGRLAGLLDALSHEDDIVGAAACSPSGNTLVRTAAYPVSLACEGLRRAFAAVRDVHFSEVLDGRAVRVSVVPVTAGAELLGRVVLVHDTTAEAYRERDVVQVTAGMFGLVALVAAVLMWLAQRAWWRSWTHELRRVLFLSCGTRAERSTRGPFQPLLADVRRIIAELATDTSREGGDRWSAERLHSTLQRSLHGESVVVLSNREPYLHQRGADGAIQVEQPASGLVTALEPVMRACSGTWIAHGSGSADREVVDARDRVSVPPGEDAYQLRRVWLSAEEEQGHYAGISNEGLWPLCHIAHVRPTFRAADWRHYATVNARFADAAAAEVEGRDPIVLVQDYHLALAPGLIRDRVPRATVITFWHIPWPNAERFGTCPFAKELITGLLGSTVLGFHTQLHCNNFLESVERFLEARIDRERQAVVFGGRETLVRAYPISVEWPSRVAARVAPAPACREAVWAELGLGRDALLGVGVDRLDYTKGIVERLGAVERLLERFPHLRGRFTFVQLSAPSRTTIESYRALEAHVEEVVARINGRFAAGAYRPVVLLRAHHSAERVFRFLRAADVCYVSSLDDGMNLVAKEFIAARDDERGVLVLSRFTGAARELREALVVNPYDLEEASGALAAAVRMPGDEQAERMRAMRASVAEFNVYRWAGHMLTDAARVRQSGRLWARLSPGDPATEEVYG